MKVLYATAFIILNIVSTSQKISSPIVAIIGFFLILLIARKSSIEGNGALIIILELLCFTWSSAWRNIFGGYVGELHLPWFYVIGAALIVYVIAFKRTQRFNKKEVFLVSMLLLVGFVAAIRSNNINEGFTEYITMLFVFVVVMCVDNVKVNVSIAEYNSLMNSYINAMVISSIGIIIQSVFQTAWSINIIENSQTVFLGGDRIINSLMFSDVSSASIFIALASVVIVFRWKMIKFSMIKALIILSAIGLSSVRTGIVTFVLVMIVYILFSRTTIVNKFFLFIGASFASVFGIAMVERVRNIGDTGFLYDNGRFDGYMKSLEIYLSSNILFGIGFGDTYLSSLMNAPIPHFALLKLLIQCGVIYFILLIMYFAMYIKRADKSGIGVYLLIGTIIGACFIPALFSAKFLVIVLSIICIENKLTNEVNSRVSIRNAG